MSSLPGLYFNGGFFYFYLLGKDLQCSPLKVTRKVFTLSKVHFNLFGKFLAKSCISLFWCEDGRVIAICMAWMCWLALVGLVCRRKIPQGKQQLGYVQWWVYGGVSEEGGTTACLDYFYFMIDLTYCKNVLPFWDSKRDLSDEVGLHFIIQEAKNEKNAFCLSRLNLVSF